MLRAVALAAGVLAVLTGRALADEVADFYRGRTVQVVAGHEVGSGFDVYGRALARHMSRHIPGNPTMVSQNMVGAVGLVAANWLYNVAPKDGTAIAIFAHSAPLDPLLGQGAAKFDPQKFTWIGNMDEAVGVCGVWHTTGVTKFEELQTKEVLFGASGSGTAGPLSQSPTALKNLFGARIKMVQGYKGSTEIKLALVRGEVQGICGLPLSTLKTEWREHFSSGEYRPLLQLSRTKHAELGSVPHVFDLARSAEERQVLDLIFGVQAMGRPFAAPPGVPPERAKALREAFMATMQDPVFLAEAEKTKLDLKPISGDALATLLAGFYASSPAVVERARQAIRPAP
jgi:tripartite-type tricarboxylate transporter receptor subunit TctC